ncbi:MAG: deoxyribose-phosphate aldolase [Lachnospiraceae bacterium]|nr:deoxyribose-phosphate aldolase [Lachnospiraceae bacterium]
MRISYKDIPKMIDVSCVRTDVTYEEIKAMALCSIKYGFICAFAMPCFTKMLKEYLLGSNVMLGGVVGFPSGADTMQQKIDCAKYMKSLGCDEIDMVINVGALRSRDDAFVSEEIEKVVEAADGIPVKSILEIAYLTDDEIIRGCKAAVKGGVTFVKSGTGWASKPTIVETIELMKKAVGNTAKIKAAGGVRTLNDLEAMAEAGCERFGISMNSALNILKEAYDRDGVEFK